MLLHQAPHLAQKRGAVLYLMHHPKAEDEIRRIVEPQGVRPALVKPYPGQQPLAFSAALYAPEHLFLKINGDHPSLRPHETRQRQRKIPHAAADVDCGLPRPNQPAKDRNRIVEKTTERIIEGIGKPPGARMSASLKEFLKRVCHELDHARTVAL
jgi:hypothetical protein